MARKSSPAVSLARAYASDGVPLPSLKAVWLWRLPKKTETGACAFPEEPPARNKANATTELANTRIGGPSGEREGQ
jgi:hypothetical protein